MTCGRNWSPQDLDRRAGGVPYAIRQHRGEGQRSPAVDRLRRLLADGAVPIDRGALSGRSKPEAKRSKAAAIQRFHAWRRILPRSFRRMDVEELISAMIALKDCLQA